MAAAVEATYNCGLTIEETVALGLDNSDDVPIVRDLGEHRGTLKATTPIKVSKSWDDTGVLSGGTALINLTALSNGNLPNVNFTDLRVKLIKITCPAANTHAVVFVPNVAADPYDIFGTADDRVSVPAGGSIVMLFADKLEDCDGTHKNIALTSGDADAAYSIAMVAGGT